MGVNRNRQWDEEMYIYWGPHEVVDGSRYRILGVYLDSTCPISGG
jgi:hypothetical protein